MTESYDPDEDRRSPGLEATKPDYKPHKDPTPPFLIKEAKEPEGEFKYSPGEGTPDCSRKPQSNLYRPESNEANSVLISYIDPNRPDIANYERSDPLRPEHFRDILCDDLLERPIVKYEKPKLESPVAEPAKPREPQSETDASEAAKRALALLELPKPIDEPLEPPEIPVKSHIPSPEARAGVKTEILSPKISQPPPPALPSISEKKPFSPPLSQYTISVHPSPDVLPPFHSPDNTTTLPPIQTALRGLAHVNEPAVRVNGSSPYSLPPVTASSPPGLRSDPVWEHQRSAPFVPPPQIPPSPYSHLSPASTKDLSAVSSPATQSSYWRPQKSDIPYITSTYDIAHCEAKSPATSYPTPTDQTPGGTCDRTPYNPSPQQNGVVTSGAYKCRHPGCTAPPFQTQYLLNSHANVHSQDRPHFCPVEGCPRGIGGKGFKRKNEMIRHGLVHNSPGYVCPFCPDQQHKYPRPDNLQRHVRVHHVDKNKDDPQLRLVLSQRPEGSARGRRRRINP
ncbi:C2H2 finger domain transcription factor [Aspergillus arachidicola]|uniref:C2H2 finger domain transcription factor n=1 Tax=Aspergillus arachidicola TaxID=656916 RepID=A0A2G7G889_9EURO|nr:C2H2 finger domain transcription factor [Aspergillus arachidicola]